MRRFLALACFGLLSLGAHASVVTFNFEYSGAPLGNGATGSGFVSLDTSILPNEAIDLFNVPGTELGVTDFEITISGSAGGNGTFTLDDLRDEAGWVWSLSGAVDLTAELVGQANFVDFNWLCEANGAVCSNPDVPQGTFFGEITTAGGDALVLTSLTAIPVPAAVWLFGSALMGLGVAGRKRAA